MDKTYVIRYAKQLLIVFLIFVLSGLLYQLRYVTTDSQQHVDQFQADFIKKEKEVGRLLDEFIASYQHTGGRIIRDAEYLDHLEGLFNRKGVVFLIYQDDLLHFWSHNSLPLNEFSPPEQDVGTVYKDNGWYYFNRVKLDNKDYIVYYSVKQSFRYQNRFLVNRIHHDLPAVESLFFFSDRPNEGYSITDENGNYMFSLVLRREAALVKTVGIIYGLSVFTAFVALITFIFFSFRFFSTMFRAGRRHLATGGLIGAFLLMRFISYWLQFPAVFYESFMFSPSLYATSDLLPSLGDLFLNVVMITVIAYFLYYNLQRITLSTPKNRTAGAFSGISLFVLIYLICGLSLYLIRGLVINSNLNLDVNFIFNLDVYSLAGFLIIGFIFFAFFFFSVVLCRLALRLLTSLKRFWIVCLATLGTLILLNWIIFGANPLLWMLALAAALVFELDRRSEFPEKGFTALVISLFLFSLISTFALYRFNQEKDLEKRKTLILQLASEQDPVAEFLFLEIEQALFNDNQLQNMVRRDPFNEAAIYNYLTHHYFYDFWAKYDLQVTVCEPGEILLIKPSNVEMECGSFFEDYIDAFGKPTISEHFVYLDNNTGRNSYIVRLPVLLGEMDDHTATYHIYIEFDSKFVARDMGFPDLLIDDAIDINRELINYSYATYKDGLLVNEYGPFLYGIHASVFEEPTGEFTVYDFDGFTHLMYLKDEDTVLIISRPKSSFLEALAPFSYSFITFFILLVVFWLLVSRKRPDKLLRMNFRRRVQIAIITMLLVSSLSIGGASAWFIFNIYENKNLAFLNEKTNSVVLELEGALADVYYLDYTMEYYLYDLLLQKANIFYTDINLYSKEGILIASSRPKVFEEGLVGNKMNAKAFFKMYHDQKSQFVHNERIGKLEYLSAYMPLYNRYSEVIAYVNLPYFAKESELRNEMSYFLVAFINIYLLLLVLAIVLALFASNYVTKPLQLIRDKLGQVQLGKSNQKIQWGREDEIGGLISEYNRMIDELSVSAELLAKSERESAWREMARQVAHEIKNPLTPMKLSVQYLEKAWNEKVSDWDKRLERFSKTMVEQIDNLSVIAGEFSDFAKMPVGKNNLINLRKFIPEALDFYKDFEKVDIRIAMPEGNEPIHVFADRNQLVRVFNNLVKNAMQSYEKNETAIITVSCRKQDKQFVITVADQGCGIPDKLKPDIFNPYFTTKAKGMGLGLSMVKSIIENMGGRVSFMSEEGRGSTFVFTLPEGRPATG